MKVILQENVENLGLAGDIVNVKTGYLRNFLLPRKLAMPADEKNLKALGHQKRMVEAKKLKVKRSAEGLKGQLEKIDCTISKTAGEEDRLFGTVTKIDICENLAEQGIHIDKKNIHLEEPIKSLGIYTVPVKLHDDIIANLKVWVVKK